MEMLQNAGEAAVLGRPKSLPSLWSRSLTWIGCAAAAAALAVTLLPDRTRDVGASRAEPVAPVGAPAEPAPAAARSSASQAGPEFLKTGGFSLPLPRGWRHAPGAPDAALTAVSADGLATTTLWIERQPDLGFAAFERNSLASLATLGDNARVVERTMAPRIEASSASLRAEVPAAGGGSTPYLVTLRASGPFRYRLATTIQPGASASLLSEAEVLGKRLRPWLID